MEAKMRVLIADPDSEYRMLLTDMIHNQGDMEVVGDTGNGLEALELIAKHKPDVVLTELMLTKFLMTITQVKISSYLVQGLIALVAL